MFWRLNPLSALLSSLGLLLAPASGAAESAFGPPGHNASAALNFRIVIPAVMRVLENSHPEQLTNAENGAHSVQQRLVVVSNMTHGFCAHLRQTDPQINSWQLQASQDGSVSLSRVADGYRLCTARPGRYTLLLQHEFQTAAGTDVLRWPVQTDVTAL